MSKNLHNKMDDKLDSYSVVVVVQHIYSKNHYYCSFGSDGLPIAAVADNASAVKVGQRLLQQ